MLPYARVIAFLVAIPLLLLGLPLIQALRHADARNPNKRGIEPLIEGSGKDEDADVFDIIVVHGLGADPSHTWSARRKGGGRIHWLEHQSLLPRECPNARILAFNHTASWLYQATTDTASSIAEGLLREILKMWGEQPKRPLVLVGHSYGGNIIKEAICKTSENDKFKDIRPAVAGIVFLGTPHLGSPLAWVLALFAQWFALFLGSNDTILTSLRLDDPNIRIAHDRFNNVCLQDGHGSLNLWEESYCFYENKPTALCGRFFFRTIVNRESATGGRTSTRNIEFFKNHTDLNKFANREDPDFKAVCAAINSFSNNQRAVPVRTKQLKQVILETARSIVGHISLPIVNQGSIDELTKAFLESTEYHEWRSGSESKLLWYKCSSNIENGYPIHHAIQQSGRQATGHDLAYFLHEHPEQREHVAAATLLRVILAQLIICSDTTLITLGPNGLRTILRVLKSSRTANLDQQEYFDVLDLLLELDSDKVITIFIEGLHLVLGDNKVSLLKRLIGVCVQHESRRGVKLLFSSAAFDEGQELLKDIMQYDPNRNMLANLEKLRMAAANPQEQLIDKGLPHTGDWFKKTDKYGKFDSCQTSAVFWLCGHAGSGKSTLMRKLLDALQETHGAPSQQTMLSKLCQAMHQSVLLNSPKSNREGSTIVKKVVVASFFYYRDKNDRAQMSHRNMMLSLLYQILWQEPGLLSVMLPHFKQKSDARAWNWDKLQEVFLSISKWEGDHIEIYLCVDAINESDEEDSGIKRQDVLEFLEKLWSSTSKRTVWKIILASRDPDRIAPGFHEKNLIRLHDTNTADIERVIADGMGRIQTQLTSHEVITALPLSELREKIKAKAGGVILWVKLVLEMVYNALKEPDVKPKKIIQYVERLPPKHEDLYKEIVDRLKNSQHQMQTKYWLHCGALAFPNLKVDEFNDAVALCPPEGNDISSAELMPESRLLIDPEFMYIRTALSKYCGGFLELKFSQGSPTDSIDSKGQRLKRRPKDSIVQLSHETVKVFLAGESAMPFQISETAGHSILLDMCIRYLDLALDMATEETRSHQRLLDRLESLPLLPYVLQNLPHHMNGVPDGETKNACSDRIKHILCRSFDQPGWELRSLVYSWIRRRQSVPTKSNSDLWEECEVVARKQWPEVSRSYQTKMDGLFESAVRRGFSIAFRVLMFSVVLHPRNLKRIQNIVFRHVEDGDSGDVIEAMNAASTADGVSNADISGDSHVLMSEDDESDSIDGEMHPSHTALHSAAENGTLEVVRYLLQRDADVNGLDRLQSTPLHYAVTSKNTSAVRLLLNNGAEVNSQDMFGRTPLIKAVSNADESIVLILLEHLADPNIRDLEGQSPISIAADSGHDGVIRALIEAGADVSDIKSEFRKRPLTIRTIPIELPPEHVSRDEYTSDIDSAFSSLQQQAQSRVVILTGVGGVGKTHLAAEYAHLLSAREASLSIIWVDGSSPSRFLASCQYYAQWVGFNDHTDADQDLVQYFGRWLADENNGPWLLVLDNVEEHSMLEKFRPLLRNPKGRVIVTTRDRGVVRSFPGNTSLTHVRVFTSTEGRQMLEQRIQSALTDALVAPVLGITGGLPLSLASVAAFIRSNGITLQQYLELYGESRLNAIQLQGREFEERRGPPGLSNSLTTTLAVTFDQISTLDTHAGHLLSYLSVIYADDCPKSLAEKLVDTSRFHKALAALKRYSLIRQNENGSLSMHRLVQEAAYQWANKRNEFKEFQTHALKVVESEFPHSADFEYWPSCRILLPHAESVLKYKLDKDDEFVVSLLENVGKYLRATGQLDGALEKLHDAYMTACRIWDTEHTKTTFLLSELATTYARLGQWADADRCERIVLARRTKLFGLDHADSLTSMVNLASICRNRGELHNLQEARELGLKAMIGRRNNFGPLHPATLDSMRSLAETYIYSGQLEEANYLQRKVLDSQLQTLGQESADTLNTMNDLSITYSYLGRWTKAEEMARKVLLARRERFPSQHPSILRSMANLASIYRDQEKWEQAEELDQEAVEICNRIFGRDHPDTLSAFGNLAVTYRGQRRWREAEETERMVAEARKRVLGEEHHDTLMSFAGLVVTLLNLDRIEEAEALESRLLEIRERRFGRSHPETLMSLGSLAVIYRKDGRLEDAKKLDEEMKGRIKPWRASA